MRNSLRLSTCMAPNMDFICRDMAKYLSRRLDIPVESRLDMPWQERERLLDEGEIDLCWLCGLPYVWKAERTSGRIEALAAPVMAGSRYQNRPIYFSDVVVRHDSPFETLEDLRGGSWAINEPGSHSGYNVVRYALAARGESGGNFFGRVIASGAHQNSLGLIRSGEVDGSAIDSTVLEVEIDHDPELSSQLRIIDTFGPSPIPPWVVGEQVPTEMRSRLRDLLCQMDQDAEGRSLLAKGRMARFMAVKDQDYNPIREMERIGEKVQLNYT